MRTLDSLVMLRRYGLAFNPDVVIVGYTTANDITDTLFRVSRPELDAELSAEPSRPVSWLYELLRERWAPRFREAASRRRAEFLDAPPLPAESAPVNPYLALAAHRHADFLSLNLDVYSRGARHAWLTNERILRRIFVLVRASGARPVLVVFPSAPQVSEASHEPFRRMGFIVDPGLASRSVVQDMAKDLCRRDEVSCLDLLPVFRSRRDELLFREKDDHFSERGESLAFDAISRFIWPPR